MHTPHHFCLDQSCLGHVHGTFVLQLIIVHPCNSGSHYCLKESMIQFPIISPSSKSTKNALWTLQLWLWWTGKTTLEILLDRLSKSLRMVHVLFQSQTQVRSGERLCTSIQLFFVSSLVCHNHTDIHSWDVYCGCPRLTDKIGILLRLPSQWILLTYDKCRLTII